MRIPTFSQNTDPVLRKMDRAIEIFIILMFGCLTLMVCCSCGSTKHVTQLVEHTSIDTIYLSNVQYDSIYIMQDKFIDRSRDTLYIKDKSIEYRYKLHRDTVKVVQRDSIPYEVTITQVKEIQRPLTIFDRLCRICFGICLSGFFILILCLIKGIRTKLCN